MNKEDDIVNDIIEGDISGDRRVVSEFLQDFIIETREHIEDIENNVIAFEKEPDNQEMINSIFRSFHTIKGTAGFVNEELVQKIAHQTESIMDACRKKRINVDKKIIDMILKSCDYIGKICDDNTLNYDDEFCNVIMSHLEALKAIYNMQETNKDIPQSKQPNNQNTVSDDKSVHKTDDTIQQITNKVASSDGGYTRIPMYKIDNLVDTIGELIINQSLVEQQIAQRFDSNDTLNGNMVRMARITKDIQNLSMSLRMVSLKSTFRKISRIARDTISELGKDIDVDMQGDDTEIDRSVAEKLFDPLVHLVKNAIDHGIEDKQERKAKNKPARGRVVISAYSKKGNVYIQISDDGRGIPTDKVYKKAKDKKLIDLAKSYTDKEITDFIFLPGFSTSETVNNISGRGVGMDVVRTEMARIGGKVSIENKQGYGCTFILKIPINLAVMDGTVIDIMGDKYIIPTLNIRQILQPQKSQWISIKGKKVMLCIRDEIVPLIEMHKLFGKKYQPSYEDLVVILEFDQKLIGLPVSNVIGKREIVVKPLGETFSSFNYISGASILGDGKVSFILDIEELFKKEGVI